MNKKFFDDISNIVQNAHKENAEKVAKEQEVNFDESEVKPIEGCPGCGQPVDPDARK